MRKVGHRRDIPATQILRELSRSTEASAEIDCGGSIPLGKILIEIGLVLKDFGKALDVIDAPVTNHRSVAIVNLGFVQVVGQVRVDGTPQIKSVGTKAVKVALFARLAFPSCKTRAAADAQIHSYER
jgi:hypothetical protein